MDTSTDDLFSDLDRFQQPTLDLGAKSEVQSFKFQATVKQELLNILVQKHEDLEHALVYDIALCHLTDGSERRTQVVTPWLPSIQSPEEWTLPDWSKLIRPCALILKNTEQASRNRPAAEDIPIIPVSSVSWSEALSSPSTPISPTSNITWLLGFPEGSVYQFRRADIGSDLIYSLICRLPSCESVYSWVMIQRPLQISTMDHRSGQTLEEILICLGRFGNGVAIWPVGQTFQTTKFSVPIAPGTVSCVETHGSWLHLATDTGHILSVHVSCTAVTEEASGRSYVVRCEPANFPRVPTLILPSRTVTDQAKLKPQWRFFDIRGFCRLPDGHLGGVQSSGEKVRLTDLLCRPPLMLESTSALTCWEMLEPSSLNCLTRLHRRSKAYLALLHLFGVLDKGNQPQRGISNEAPLQAFLSVAVRMELFDGHAGEIGYPLELIVDVKLKGIPNESTMHSSSISSWESLSIAQLVSLLLHPAGRSQSNFDAALNLTIKLIPFFQSVDKPNTDEEDGLLRLPLYTYSEPWFIDDENAEATQDGVRHLRLPSIWSAHIQSGVDAKQGQTLIGLSVSVSLQLDTPTVPSVFFQPTHDPPLPSSTRQLHGPPLSLSIHEQRLDMLHWLCPLDKYRLGSGVISNPTVDNTSPMMHYHVPSRELLNEILSDVTKTKYCSKTSFRQIINAIHLPTQMVVRLSWTDSRHSAVAANGLAETAVHLLLRSNCPQTLLKLHLCMTQRLTTKQDRQMQPTPPGGTQGQMHNKRFQSRQGKKGNNHEPKPSLFGITVNRSSGAPTSGIGPT